ncbi:MAG: VWA domain-containing protein [candidate division Zixibacteria bacterium]
MRRIAIVCVLISILFGCGSKPPPSEEPFAIIRVDKIPPRPAPPPRPALPTHGDHGNLNYQHPYPKAPWLPEYNTEEYSRIYENRFLLTTEQPLSTFGVDVDAASYSNVRRYIQSGNHPPRDAVRIEELINYFNYDYPQPDGVHPFSVNTEVADCPWNPRHDLVLIGLQGAKLNQYHLPPSNLVFLIDVSGSMNNPKKLPLLKKAFKLLVNHIRQDDRIAIVTYSGRARLVLPSTPGYRGEEIIRAIDRLHADGSTAGAAGIELAYREAWDNFIDGGNNRVVLATDGDFNVGVSSTSELVRMIEEKRRSGIFLSVLGFGTGNLKDSRMEQLADKGNGYYAYVDNLREAKRVMIREMNGTLHTIAKDVKMQVEFNPAHVKAYRLIGYENRILDKRDFNNDRRDAGDIGVGHSVTALYEIIPNSAYYYDPGTDPLRYQSRTDVIDNRYEDEIMMLKLRYKTPNQETSRLISTPVYLSDSKYHHASDNFKFAVAVAEYGMLLNDSRYRGSASFNQAMDLARESIGADRDGYRREFIDLCRKCLSMKFASALHH